MKCRLAIRAANFETEPTFLTNSGRRISTPEKKRGSFGGAIRIPLHALSFLFNDLTFLRVPRKSLKFHSSLFSIPTAPTNIQGKAVAAFFCYRATETPDFPRQTVFLLKRGLAPRRTTGENPSEHESIAVHPRLGRVPQDRSPRNLFRRQHNVRAALRRRRHEACVGNFTEEHKLRHGEKALLGERASAVKPGAEHAVATQGADESPASPCRGRSCANRRRHR